jgi:hypothetical protein
MKKSSILLVVLCYCLPNNQRLQETAMKLIDDLRRENLAILREECGSVAALAKRLERSESQISQWLLGSIRSKTGKPSNMKSATARWIEEQTGKPLGWMDVDHANDGAIDLESHPDLSPVKRVSIHLSAGIDGYEIQFHEEEGPPVFFRRDWMRQHGYKADRLVAVRVKGQSMETGLWAGDLVVVNLDDVEPKDGEVFAVNYEGQDVVKRLTRDAGDWWLTSDNADQRRYPKKLCTQDVKIIGRVVYKQSEVI